MMYPFKLVTFDVMGTLLKTALPMGEIYSRVGRSHGIQSDPQQVYKNFKRGWALLNQEHPNYGLRTGIGWAEWWQKLVVMSLGDGPGSEAAADELINLFGRAEGWCPIDCALPLLQNLKTNGIHLGVISNFDPRLQPILHSLGMDKFFTFVATSYEADALKPDPAIFRYSEKLYQEATGDFLEKHYALHVGDSLELDYCGARGSGWNAAIVNSGDYISPGLDSQWVFRNLCELKTYFENHCKRT